MGLKDIKKTSKFYLYFSKTIKTGQQGVWNIMVKESTQPTLPNDFTCFIYKQYFIWKRVFKDSLLNFFMLIFTKPYLRKPIFLNCQYFYTQTKCVCFVLFSLLFLLFNVYNLNTCWLYLYISQIFCIQMEYHLQSMYNHMVGQDASVVSHAILFHTPWINPIYFL